MLQEMAIKAVNNTVKYSENEFP